MALTKIGAKDIIQKIAQKRNKMQALWGGGGGLEANGDRGLKKLKNRWPLHG